MTINRRRYLATVGASVVGLSLAGCSEDEGDSGEGSPGGGGNGGDSGSGSGNGGGNGGSGGDQPDVEILNHDFYSEEYQSGVRGTAQNNTDRELSYVEASAVFLDAEGTQIGDGLDNVSDLAAGRKWEFDCMYLGSDPERIDSYEVEVSNGF